MVSRQTLLVGSVVVLATLSVVAPAAASAGAVGAADRGVAPTAGTGDLASATTTQTTPDGANGTGDGATANDSGNGTDFGTKMAAFMQSNAAQVNDSVENGMWEAAFERANESKRARLAHGRVDSLSERVAELRERNRTLQQRYENDPNVSEEYVVAAARLNGRMEALEHAVNGTARAAKRAGINATALDELRNRARNLTGPEVAGIARGLLRGDRGPPAGVTGRGPQGANATDRPGGGPPNAAPGGTGVAGNATQADDGGDSGNENRGEGASGDSGEDEPGRGPGARDDGSANDDDPGADGDRKRGPPSLLARDTLIR